MKHTCLMIGFSLVALSAHVSRASDLLMYVNDSANRLLTVDVATGHVERLGTTGAQFTDIAFSLEERLYGVTRTYLYEIDPANGRSTLIGRHGFGEPGHSYGIDSLTFASDNTLYAAGSNVLIRIDTDTGAGTAVGTLSGYSSAGDMAADAQGRLFLTSDAGMLLEVNRDGSGAMPIGSLPYTDIYAFAGTAGGVLYGIRSTNEIVNVSPDTGQATIVGELGGDFLGYSWGGSFPHQFAPEPSSLVICLSGAAFLALRGRKCRNYPTT
ncbi:MAG: hypothetical protein GY842_02025 [bacterium]|nr:hypothetical protein [bacterium]